MFDLVSVVGHVNDTTLDGSDDSNDNLVAHIRVGPSYHQRKEVCSISVYSSKAMAPTMGGQAMAGQTGFLHVFASCGTFQNFTYNSEYHRREIFGRGKFWLTMHLKAIGEEKFGK